MKTKQRRLLTYKTRDGFEVNALLVTPEFESEDELFETPIIVNIHGVLGHFLARGTPQILPPSLLEKRISTLSVNTRMGFFGQIFGEGIFVDSIQEIKESVSMLEKMGFRNIFILGYSLGANLAVYYATRTRRLPIRGLILEGCSYSLPDSQKRRLDRNRSIPNYEDIYRRAKEILDPDPHKSKNDQVFIVYRAWGDSFNPVDVEMFTYRTWWFMRSPEADYAKTCDLVSKLKLPILFIHGENDDVVDTWEPKELVKILNNAGNNEVDIKYISDAKHDCMENPEETVKTIVDWLPNSQKFLKKNKN